MVVFYYKYINTRVVILHEMGLHDKSDKEGLFDILFLAKYIVFFPEHCLNCIGTNWTCIG
jgi:hypothetical protein